jgi:hypothetical protein
MVRPVFNRDCRVLRRAHPCRDVDAPGPIGREPDRDDLVDGTRQDFANEADAVGSVRHPRDRRIEVQLPPVAVHVHRGGKRQQEIADWLKWHLPHGPPEHLVRDQRVRLAVLPGEDQSPGDRQRVERLRICGIVRSAGPQCVFVELKTFVLDAAEHHAREPAVPDRQRFDPFVRRLAIPQRQRRLWRRLELSCRSQRAQRPDKGGDERHDGGGPQPLARGHHHSGAPSSNRFLGVISEGIVWVQMR